MNCDATIRDLENAINFIKMEKDLKPSRSSIIFPLLAMIAILTGNLQPSSMLLAVALAVFVILGILMMARPSPSLLLADVIPVAIFGSYVIAADLSLWATIVLETILLLSMIFAPRRYLDAQRKVRLKPGPEVMAFIESTAKDLRQDKRPDSDDVIELHRQGVAYRILLGECAAIFVGRDDLFAQSRDEEVITLDSAGEGAEVYIVSTQYTKWQKWRISTEHYQRYLAWKEHQVKQEGILI